MIASTIAPKAVAVVSAALERPTGDTFAVAEASSCGPEVPDPLLEALGEFGALVETLCGVVAARVIVQGQSVIVKVVGTVTVYVWPFVAIFVGVGQ